MTTLLGTRSPCSSTVLCEPDSLVQVFAHAAGTQVVRWHRDANNVELVYGLFDERGVGLEAAAAHDA